MLALVPVTAGCDGDGSASLSVGEPVSAPRLERPQLSIFSDRKPAGIVIKTLGRAGFRPLQTDLGEGEPSYGYPTPWSPDGERLAINVRLSSAEDDSRTTIFTVGADGSGLRRLTSEEYAFGPAWSPDGRLIAYSRASDPDSITGSSSLWAIRTDGSHPEQLTDPENGQHDVAGAFSPDGSLLAFTRFGPFDIEMNGLITGEEDVYVLDLDGSGVTHVAEESVSPSFSPDGNRLVMASARDHNGTLAAGEDENKRANEIYTVALDGSDPERLTFTKSLDETYPSFSPDGSRIAYQREEDRFHDGVFQMNSDGTCPVAIEYRMKGFFGYSAPAWRPGLPRSGGGPLRC